MAGTLPNPTILKFAELLWQPGDVREVRVLKHNKWGHTASGYFDSPESLACVAAGWDGRANVYLSLNPTNPALLARANNRIADKAEHSTADADILQRRWLLVDIDPVRPAGISSSEDERGAALGVVGRLTDFLSGEDWPAPVTAMSGNGYYALYRVDLPNTQDAGALVKGVLESLAQRFDTTAAHIDTSVFNASRIACLIGTTKVKGDAIPDRPHRQSELLNVPDPVVIVTEEQLRALLQAPGSVAPRDDAEHTADLPSVLWMLGQAGIEFRVQPPDTAGIVWYNLHDCPFCGAESGGFKCGVGQTGGHGAYVAKCFCEPERHWQEFKHALGLGRFFKDQRSQASGADYQGPFSPADTEPVQTQQPTINVSNRQLQGSVADARVEHGSRLRPAGSAIFDTVTEDVALWGEGDEVLWSAGEPLMIYGPTGTGKTTVIQQLVLASIGLREPTLFGLAVAPRKRWLYLALDRPAQIKRSLRRMVSEEDREVLDEKLIFHDGPLDFDLAQEPERLLELAQQVGADAVAIDSLKDAAAGLEKSDVGQLTNRAHQLLVSHGIELLLNHHPRKAQVGNTKPKAIDDVFGSRFVVDGCGSAVLLWGAPGDAVVELSHLKQPRDSVGPWTLVHDHSTGTTRRDDQVDAFTVISTARGISAEGIARVLFKSERPSRSQVENARRKAQALVRKGFVIEQAGTSGGKEGGSASLFFRRESVHAPFTDRLSSDSKSVHGPVHAPSVHDSTTPFTPAESLDSEGVHESVHAVHDPTVHVSAPLYREGGRDGTAVQEVRI